MTDKRTPKPRPSQLPAIVYKTASAHGNIYTTVTWYEGEMFEVFVQVGKAGGCFGSQAEAMARMISLPLRSGGDPQPIADQLKGITCDPEWHDGKQSVERR